MKIRLDQFLVQRGWAPSRTKAQDMIAAGWIEVKPLQSATPWKIETSVSYGVDESRVEVRLREGVESSETLRFVSRGGHKLEGALEAFKVNVEGLVCLDVGQSTGGFTDCLLQRKARHVVGVDVGHGQLHKELRNDPRVVSFEGLHLRDLGRDTRFLAEVPPGGFDLVVADLSFISAIRVLDDVLRWGRNALVLIKPQFEMNEKKEVVFNDKLFDDLVSLVESKLAETGRKLRGSRLSAIRGKDGSQEIFIYI